MLTQSLTIQHVYNPAIDEDLHGKQSRQQLAMRWIVSCDRIQMAAYAPYAE